MSHYSVLRFARLSPKIRGISFKLGSVLLDLQAKSLFAAMLVKGTPVFASWVFAGSMRLCRLDACRPSRGRPRPLRRMLKLLVHAPNAVSTLSLPVGACGRKLLRMLKY